ncbi:DNA replication/repair protein RecF [Arthrobacter sp. zg-Y916]|uniref:DNA replication and repair protein RecF n=1 Tax=Arthrobacter caoxuetaonis TaxID=2886935 RepID=A0A9X1SFE7_9MICC|nr:DNA replication/repair protein RecF [Arthrobacter caoxuetaonis]MCC3298559.1 DNA replication/repair protein RecF [Arthrobacter caoxuetaonis]MCC9194786.1 DNA replication/repair protein RecF [Arthrobacter sp. zg-Y916]USQ57304.1 DNA replication/repair protein RecF [Arthrobacter caoxuetaonis]
MYVDYLSLTGFRSYGQLDLSLEPGVSVFVGPNGTGKTNIVESIGYLASLSSHRVSSDAPLVAFDADQALVRARIVRGSQATALEVEINPGRANRARINRANPVRARDILGICRTVLFAPEDLALVKGDPSARRRFLDDMIVSLVPRHAATRADYERVLKQRNALLKSARMSGRFTSAHEATLDVWDHHMAAAGAQLLAARLQALDRLSPHLAGAYADLTDGSKAARGVYRSTLLGQVEDDGAAEGPADSAELLGLGQEELQERFLQAFAANRKREVDRGISLVGPHRDEVELLLGPAPAKGYASHGETWSLALAMRLASYYLLRDDDDAPGSGPILILDDVFAELDAGRRQRLAAIVSGAEQVLVTAAVGEDIPAALSGRQIPVIPGGVSAAAG